MFIGVFGFINPVIKIAPTPTLPLSIGNTSVSPLIPTTNEFNSKPVDRGDVIGIMGNTGNASRPKLHFAVYNLNESDLNKFNADVGHLNPFNFLRNKKLFFDSDSCHDVSKKIEKSVGTGNWDWPMSNPIISQCYGNTQLSLNNPDEINNGIDMYDDVDTLVRAVENGNKYVYRGGASEGNGVLIFHSDGKMSLYWHLQ